jgi:hypothetical protein
MDDEIYMSWLRLVLLSIVDFLLGWSIPVIFALAPAPWGMIRLSGWMVFVATAACYRWVVLWRAVKNDGRCQVINSMTIYTFCTLGLLFFLLFRLEPGQLVHNLPLFVLNIVTGSALGLATGLLITLFASRTRTPMANSER